MRGGRAAATSYCQLELLLARSSAFFSASCAARSGCPVGVNGSASRLIVACIIRSLIEIAPKQGVYDYEAKYKRNDTVYTVEPDVDPQITRAIQNQALQVCEALGVRHLARADFLLRADGSWIMLEVNTMPGFTATSLLPKAAGAIGLNMPMFCEHLVRCAQRDPRAITSTTG